MASTDSNFTPMSGAGWTMPSLPFLGLPSLDHPHMSEQAARANLMGLDMIESWLTASRQMIDVWRTTVREIEDGMIAAYRQQIVGALAHDLLEEMDATKQAAAKRKPLTRTAVAKTTEAQAA